MRVKERPRDRVLPDKPYFTSDDLAPKNQDGRIEEDPRVDGASARGQISSKRTERTRSVHHGLDVNALAETVATGEWLWRAGDVLERELPDHGRGRPRKHGLADVLLYPLLAKVLHTNQAVERYLKNRRNWNRLSAAVAAAWPDDPCRRLHEKPPSRFQYHYVRRKYISDDVVASLAAIAEQLAVEQALHTGLFNPKLGKKFEPHKTQMVVSDGTWELAQTNATSKPTLDKVTGELTVRRHDPDAYTYRDRSKPAGNMLVFAGAPGVLPGTSVILKSAYTSGRHEQDSDVAVRMAIELKATLPGLRGVAHDKSATGKHREELFGHEMVLINGLPAAAGGKLPYLLLGTYEFKIKTPEGTRTETEAVWAIDGHPCIKVHDGNEMVYLQLERRRNLPRRRRRWNRTILYAVWAVPDHVLAPDWLKKAHVTLRHNSYPEEIAKSELIARHLLLISPYDPLYPTLYGTREFAESINNAYKQSFVNNRSRSLGLKNRRLDALGFIVVFNYESLLVWKQHTGGDIGRWFGQHDPDG